MPSAFLKWNLLFTDIGFIAYWVAAALNLFPPNWLYKDHDNPILFAWNWSFVPVDLGASVLGLLSLSLARKGCTLWSSVALLSTALTFCAGLMALSFWAIRRDFDLGWWLPNLYLISWTSVVFPTLIRKQGAT